MRKPRHREGEQASWFRGSWCASKPSLPQGSLQSGLGDCSGWKMTGLLAGVVRWRWREAKPANNSVCKPKRQNETTHDYRTHKPLNFSWTLPKFPFKNTFRTEIKQKFGIFFYFSKIGKKNFSSGARRHHWQGLGGSSLQKGMSSGPAFSLWARRGDLIQGIKQSNVSPRGAAGEEEEARINLIFIGQISSDLIIAGRYTECQTKGKGTKPAWVSAMLFSVLLGFAEDLVRIDSRLLQMQGCSHLSHPGASLAESVLTGLWVCVCLPCAHVRRHSSFLILTGSVTSGTKTRMIKGGEPKACDLSSGGKHEAASVLGGCGWWGKWLRIINSQTWVCSPDLGGETERVSMKLETAGTLEWGKKEVLRLIGMDLLGIKTWKIDLWFCSSSSWTWWKQTPIIFSTTCVQVGLFYFSPSWSLEVGEVDPGSL